MPSVKMHSDEVDTDETLVRRLLAAQFPRWADLPLRRVLSSGTDNAIYRLGDSMAVRLPRIHWAAGQVDKEYRWLPKLAPLLPLAVPLPLAVGTPAEGYPWNWSVCTWLPGENATAESISDLPQAVTELAQFIAALHGIDPTGGPPPGTHNANRGEPLSARDARTRAAIAELVQQGTFDAHTACEATDAWDAAVQTPPWNAPPVWVHGDLQAGNLLVRDGRFSGVIDFGCLGVGDPACDLLPAWNFFSAETRAIFREAVQVDEDTWARGRGWGLSTALIALPYYLNTNPEIVLNARYRIAQVLADRKLNG